MKNFKHLLFPLIFLGSYLTFNNQTSFVKANEDNLLYRLDFSNQDFTKNNGSSSFSDAIVEEDNSLTIVDGVKEKKALSFPGRTLKKNYLSLPTNIFASQEAVTISGWYYLPSEVEAYTGEIGIYSVDNDVSFRADPYASYHGNGYIYACGNPDAIDLNTGIKPVYNAWYHMSYIIDGINHQFKVYQNGHEVYTKTLDDNFKPSQFSSSNSHFYLGQSSYAGYHGESEHNDYEGKISDFRVYSGALSTNEIINNYSLNICDFKTNEYTFDSNENLYKDNIRNYSLQEYNSTPHFDDGTLSIENGSSVQFYAKNKNLNNHFFSGFSTMTISMDVNISTPSSENWKRLMDMFINDNYRITYMTSCPRIPGNVLDAVYAKNGDLNMLSDNSFVLETNKWINLTFVFDINNLHVYENGILKVSATSEDKPTFKEFFYDLDNSENGNFTLGHNTYESGNFLNAKYDNIRIYASSCLAKEVKYAINGQAGNNLIISENIEDGSTINKFVPLDENYILTSDLFSRDGYIITSYNTSSDGSGITYNIGDEISLNEDLTLYAQWTINSHLITYDSNSGRGEMSPQTVNYNQTSKVKDCEFTKTGYAFTSWNTSQDGSGKQYNVNDSISITENITLYAQWVAKNYTINFNSNHGEGNMEPLQMTYDTNKKLTKNTFSRVGYEFIGWSLTSEGTVIYKDEQDVNNLNEGNDLTLYAVWAIKKVNIVFDSNGGTGNMNNITCNALSYVALTKSTFTKENCSFMGWALSKDGKVMYNDGDTIVINDNLTLYAVWKDNTPANDNNKTNNTPIIVTSIVGGCILIGGGITLIILKKKRK